MIWENCGPIRTKYYLGRVLHSKQSAHLFEVQLGGLVTQVSWSLCQSNFGSGRTPTEISRQTSDSVSGEMRTLGAAAMSLFRQPFSRQPRSSSQSLICNLLSSAEAFVQGSLWDEAQFLITFHSFQGQNRKFKWSTACQTGLGAGGFFLQPSFERNTWGLVDMVTCIGGCFGWMLSDICCRIIQVSVSACSFGDLEGRVGQIECSFKIDEWVDFFQRWGGEGLKSHKMCSCNEYQQFCDIFEW